MLSDCIDGLYDIEDIHEMYHECHEGFYYEYPGPVNRNKMK